MTLLQVSATDHPLSAFQAAPPGSAATHANDLDLCAACAEGQTAAVQALEAAYFPALRTILQRLLGEAPTVEDVLQEIRTRLFVGTSPKIASYRGSGCLAGWLRSVAVHAAQDYLRSTGVRRARLRKFATLERVCASPASWATDPSEEALFQEQRARLCQQAWNTAIGSLGSAERQLLHHHFVSGLSIDILGALYSVHRATVARRIRRVIDRVRRSVREALAAHYRGMSIRDLDALALRACQDVDVLSTLCASRAA